MTTYEPGVVAVATVRGVPDVQVYYFGGTTGWITAERMGATRLHRAAHVTDIRPLVVLDLTAAGAHAHLNARQVATEAVNTLRASDWISDTNLADQIEAQTSTKPAEPIGLGAVVEDAEGADWHRTRDGRWIAEDGLRSRAAGWGHINAVRVLSEGVTS